MTSNASAGFSFSQPTRGFTRFAVTAALALLLVETARSAPPLPEIWKIQPISAADLANRTSIIDRDSGPVPPEARPALDFQKILLRIATHEPASTWLPDVEKFSKAGGEDTPAKALRELALCWVARARMLEIDKALHSYYGQNVRFPDRLDEVRNDIPADAKSDPWGEAWVYKATSPEGFAKLEKQRYQLGPTRYPHLSTLRHFVDSPAPTFNWKATARNVGGSKTLEIRTPDGKVAVVQAGG
ncbi:MAG TPA: hypothetical protein VGH90_13985, partial [Chthoniobacteraceae bacterium]